MGTTTFPSPLASRRLRGIHQHLASAAARARRFFELWRARTSEYRARRDLPRWLLEDVGLSPRRSPRRVQAAAARPYWLP